MYSFFFNSIFDKARFSFYSQPNIILLQTKCRIKMRIQLSSTKADIKELLKALKV